MNLDTYQPKNTYSFEVRSKEVKMLGEYVEKEHQPISYNAIFPNEVGILVFRYASPPRIEYEMENSASKEIIRSLPLLRELGFAYFGFTDFRMDTPVPENPYSGKILKKIDILEILKNSRSTGMHPIGLAITAEGARTACEKATVHHRPIPTAWSMDGRTLCIVKTEVNLSERVDEIREKELVCLFQKDELRKSKIVALSHQSEEVLKRFAQENNIKMVEVYLLPEKEMYNGDFVCYFWELLEELGIAGDQVMFPWSPKYSNFHIAPEVDWILVVP